MSETLLAHVAQNTGVPAVESQCRGNRPDGCFTGRDVTLVSSDVLNQPYGGFPWLDLPQRANENWYNALNFCGDPAWIRRYFGPIRAAREPPRPDG